MLTLIHFKVEQNKYLPIKYQYKLIKQTGK